VDVSNADDYIEIKNELETSFDVIRASTFCRSKDDNPDVDELFTSIKKIEQNTLLLGIFEYLHFKGQDELERFVAKFLSLQYSPKGKVKLVVLTFNCSGVLERVLRDPRNRERIEILRNENPSHLRLYFFDTAFEQFDIGVKILGIKSLLESFENGNFETLNVITKKVKTDFPSSAIPIKDIKNAYEIIEIKDIATTKRIALSEGTSDNWDFLLEYYRTHGKLSDILISLFGIGTDADSILQRWTSYNANQKWLALIKMKYYSDHVGRYLSLVLSDIVSIAEFEKRIFNKILDLDPCSEGFWDIYEERRELLVGFEKEVALIVAYVDLAVSIKNEQALYYLTDQSRIEQERIVTVLEGVTLDEKIKGAIEKVYPALSAYLKPYTFRIDYPMLSDYFNQYRENKATNRISQDFIDIVNTNAEKREYNKLLPYRSSEFSKLNFDPISCELYFFDALGAEFVSYIVDKCNSMKLRVETHIAHCNLPSITSVNKEFLDSVPDDKVTTIKDLDDIKHHGKDTFDYRITKLPIHLTRELKVIDRVLEEINRKLVMGSCKRVLIISDHGASRLAVINHQELDFEVYDVESKGKYGGRCCQYSDSIPSIPYAIEENGWYILANYGLFRGGRAAQVEAHGGASLEEVVVPLFEISLEERVFEVRLVDTSISVSFADKAQIAVYSSVELKEAILMINSKRYNMQDSNNSIYNFDIGDIIKAGRYTAVLYDGDNCISSDLTFEIVNAGMQETEYF